MTEAEAPTKPFIRNSTKSKKAAKPKTVIPTYRANLDLIHKPNPRRIISSPSIQTIIPETTAELAPNSVMSNGTPGNFATIERMLLETEVVKVGLRREFVSPTERRRPSASRSHPRQMENKEMLFATGFIWTPGFQDSELL
ncbi:MAG TPA: hypothetical protein VEH86_07930 [Candidatus Acidoferrum sp.]|nr:hypothetical protein [Candidatus Acidoferrum sp.]